MLAVPASKPSTMIHTSAMQRSRTLLRSVFLLADSVTERQMPRVYRVICDETKSIVCHASSFCKRAISPSVVPSPILSARPI